MAKPKGLQIEILRLFKEGKNYYEIVDELGCSIGTVFYHLEPGEKQKSYERNRTFRKNNPLLRKLTTFHSHRRLYVKYKNSKKRVREIIYSKYINFVGGSISMANFTLEELQEKIGESPKCYLTGRPIDLTQSRTYQLDHIIPISKGGQNTLENCGITCRDANLSKRDLYLEDYLQLCKEILENNGFSVTPRT